MRTQEALVLSFFEQVGYRKQNAHLKVLVAQLGARRHYAVARALQRIGYLERLTTDACAESWPWRWLQAIPSAWQPAALARLLARRVEGVPVNKIHSLPMFTLTSLRQGRRGLSQVAFWAQRNARFGQLVKAKGFGAAELVYGYNGASLEIFQAARDQGLLTVLDQTAAPWRWNTRLLQEEAKCWPGWETAPAETDPLGELAEREEAEWALADLIFCGSEFAMNSVIETGGPKDRCQVQPYAGDVVFSGGKPMVKAEDRHGGKFRVLFVGTLQLRKGIQYLAEACQRLPKQDVEIRLLGPSQLSTSTNQKLSKEMEWLGAIPRNQVQAHYQWADAFVLPTLSEGSANVCYEAIAAGIPVVTTANAGSIIRHEESGLIVPIRDAAALAESIQKLAADAELCARLAQTAAKCLQQQTLAHYADWLSAHLLFSDKSL